MILITQGVRAELPDSIRTGFLVELGIKGFHARVPAFNALLD